MITITGQLLNPVGAEPPRGSVTFVLVDYDDRAVVGFDVVSSAEILSSSTVIPAADGRWSVLLTPNASIQLAGGTAATAYRVTETGAAADGTYWIVVPATGGPYWVGALRTTLVGAAAPSPVANLAVSGALTVGGTLTLDGIAIGAPPNDSLKFLNGTGAFSVPGGGPPSGAAGGDLLGSTYPNPLLASTTNVRAIIDARIPGSLPPNGTAGGDLSGTYPAPTLAATGNVEAIIRANRLDQFATPTANVAMGGHKLTGGAVGTAGTDFAVVSQLPSGRDRNAAALGLLGQPFPYMTINNIGLGLTSGFVVLMLGMADAGTAGGVTLMLGTQGSGATGASNVCAFSQAGSLLSVGPDVTSQLSDAGNAGKTIRLPLGTSVVTDGQTNAYWGVFCQMTGDPKIGGQFNGLHLDAVGGNRPAIVVGGLSSVPSSIDVSAATTAGAGYWLAPTP